MALNKNLLLELQNNQNKSKARTTIRINIQLEESNNNDYPIYDYKQLLELEEKKEKRVVCFDDYNMEHVQKIALQMEAKYGTYSRKMHNLGRADDYCDIGMGYDEDDSFIDNTDGYDEVVPPHITTAHGGFYVNSGPLEFKEYSNSSISSNGCENEKELETVLSKFEFENPKLIEAIIEEREESEKSKESSFTTESSDTDVSKDDKLKMVVSEENDINDNKKIVLNKEQMLMEDVYFVKSFKNHQLNSSFENFKNTEQSVNGIVEHVKLEPLDKNESTNGEESEIEDKDQSNETDTSTDTGKDSKDDIFNCETATYYSDSEVKVKEETDTEDYYEVSLPTAEQNASPQNNDRRVQTALFRLKVEIDRLMEIYREKYDMKERKIAQRLNHLNSSMSFPYKLPTKRFVWSEEAKLFLFEVLSAKKDELLAGEPNEKLMQQNLKTFLNEKIMPLWPDGWISYRSLNEKIKQLHNMKTASSSNNTLATSSSLKGSSDNLIKEAKLALPILNKYDDLKISLNTMNKFVANVKKLATNEVQENAAMKENAKRSLKGKKFLLGEKENNIN